SADRRRLRAHHAVHQGRLPGQPGHNRTLEQRDRVDCADRRRTVAAAARREGGPARRDPHRRPDRGRPQLRQRDCRLGPHRLPHGPPDPKRGHPDELPKAARDWPKLNFITYHACIQPNFFLADTLADVQAGKLRGGVPNISWTTEYAQLVQGLPNCYAEIGTTWASSVVTFPTIAAHIMGQLMKFMGEDRIVFGSDSVWYGSPQWQIEALWRFQIPEAMRKKYGYPELTERAKRKILGLNSA